MKRVKSLLPLWFLLAVVVLFGSLSIILTHIEYTWRRRDTLAKEPDCFVPAADGIWRIDLDAEPTRVWTWQSEDHFLFYDCEPRRYNDKTFYFADGGSVYVMDTETPDITCIAEDLELDYTLGAGGLAVRRPSVINKHDYEVYYFPPEEGRWGSVDWCDQKVWMRTLHWVTADGETGSRELPIDPQPRWKFNANGSRVGVTRREDGMLVFTATGYSAPAGEEIHSIRYSDWFVATPGDWIKYVPASGRFIYRDTGSAVQCFTAQYNKAFESRTYTEWYPAAPHAFLSDGSTLFLTPEGALCVNSTILDRTPGLTTAQLDQAAIYGNCIVIPTNGGTRIYAAYKYELTLTRFDLPADTEPAVAEPAAEQLLIRRLL